MPEEKLDKKTVFIIAFRDFKDEEYLIPKQVLENADIEVITVSDKPGTATGVGGNEANVDLTIENLNIDNFDGIIFIGGPGALTHLDNEKSYEIAQKAVEKGKILGAICISPVILAKSGVLQDKKATVWSNALDKSAIKTLEQNEALYQDEKVVIDGKIITANGPAAAQEFGNKLVKLLTP